MWLYPQASIEAGKTALLVATSRQIHLIRVTAVLQITVLTRAIRDIAITAPAM